MADDAPGLSEGQQRALDLFNSIWADQGEVGRQVRARAKEKYPDVVLPEDTTEPIVAPLRKQLEEMQAELKAEREQRAAEKAAAEENKARVDLETMLDDARRKHNLTDSGFDAMVARMKATQNFTDAEAAAAWVIQQTPPPANPGPYLGPQNINLFGTAERNEQFELLHKDPQGRFLDAEFTEFMRDPAKYCADAGFPYQ